AAKLKTTPGDTAYLEAAAGMLEGELKGKSQPPWVLLYAARLSAEAGRADLAGRFAAAIESPGLRAWGQVEALRAKIKSSGGQKIAETGIEEPKDPKSAPPALFADRAA